MKDATPVSLPFLENLAPQAKRERPRARAALPARFATARVTRELELEDEWTGAPGSSATPAPHVTDAAPPARASTPAAAKPERPASHAVHTLHETRPAPSREPAAPSEPPHRAPLAAAEPPEPTLSPRFAAAASRLPPSTAPLRPVLSPARPVEARAVALQSFELELPTPVSAPLRPEAVASRNSDSAAKEPTVVHVTIDRIDLRADPPASAAPKRTRPETKSSLGDYLKQRDAARRGRPAS